MSVQRQGIGPAGRPPELEDPLNLYIYHPLARRLARALQPTGITPNMVSVTGGLMVVAAGTCYVHLGWPLSVAIGFTLHALWHVVDGADGDLARLTGRASPMGELIDGACDYVSHIVIYVLLAAALSEQIGGWAWFAASVAGGSRIIHTNHAETQRRYYLWWVYGVPWLKNAGVREGRLSRGSGWVRRLAGWVTHLYVHLTGAITPYAGKVDALVAAAAGDPNRLADIARLVRAASRKSLVYEKLLGGNPRTILLGLAMLLGSPLWYFLAEGVALNLLLVASVVHHNIATRRLWQALKVAPRYSAAIAAC